MSADKPPDTIDVVIALEAVLAEIGPIMPVWDAECGEYGFSHPLYPSIEAPGDTPEECISTYQRLLAKFLEERLKGNLAPHVERMTSGRGGRRPGAGRPRGIPTLTVRLPADVAEWLKADPGRIEQVRRLMA